MSKPKQFFKTFINLFIHSSRGNEGKEEEDLKEIAAKERKVFQYEILAIATHNFNPNSKLGEGGFGPVFKVIIICLLLVFCFLEGRLVDGREVAVKQLARGSRQGEKEFINEANLLSKLQHKNVVNLYGYCAHGDAKMLVYEYIANESLDKFLFSDDDSKKKMQLDWNRRYNVMVGVARGLLYMHEDAHTPIIHRDIKASNILLDERWVPKIADFGMARLYPEDQTHVNTRIYGTNGYMAPEYLMSGMLSTKADVYSFGVLILELISGRKNRGFMPLPDPEANYVLEWAYKLFKRDQSLEMMDPILNSSADRVQVKICIHIGLLCTQADPKLRPDMKRVVLILSKKMSALEEPTKPGLPGLRYRRRTHVGHSSYSSGESSSCMNKASSAASIVTSSATIASTNSLSPRVKFS